MHAGAYDVIAEPHPDAIHHLLVTYARHALHTITDAVALLDTVLDLAVGSAASDVHLVTTSTGLRVRQRVDGDLHDVTTVDTAIATALIARTKVRAGLDVAERRLPQDGRLSHAVPDGVVDVRVATMPTRSGERITLRLLPSGATDVGLDGLGLPPTALDALGRAIEASDGLILVCGPTGSGKTTTLHALLTRIVTGPRNVITLEDPIERIIDGTSQTQVDPSIGLGFADGLRHLLRHDPDVILVGEIRDRETAHLAVEAAHTGHLVLSSLHAIDAPGAVSRLRSLGVPAAMLADTLRVVVAQRLLALPCPDCDGPRTGAPVDAGRDGRDGCDGCGGAGTRGRSAIAETLEVDESLRRSLRDGGDGDVLAGAVMPRLRTLALERAAIGLARPDDAVHATPADTRT
jgi:general secretion pathway protein E